MRVRFAVASSAVAALVGLTACSGGGGKTTSDPSGKPKVAVVTNCIADFWSICEAGAKKAGQEHNADVVFRMPQNNTVADQMEIVEAELNKGISGIAVSVINPSEQTPALKRIAGKTNLLAMDNDAPDSGRKCYIGVDNYEAGKAVGRLVKKALPDGGTVALFIGSMASANAKYRIAGVLDELAGQKDAPSAAGTKLGKYTLEDIHTDDTIETKAQENAKDVLEKLKGTPNLCLIGLYAYNPKAILLAARAKGQAGKVTIAGFDEDGTTLEGVAAGEIVGTVVQDPFQYGYKSVEILAALARGDQSKAVDVPIPYRLVTKDGGPDETVNGAKIVNLKVADFKKELEQNLASAKK